MVRNPKKSKYMCLGLRPTSDDAFDYIDIIKKMKLQ